MAGRRSGGRDAGVWRSVALIVRKSCTPGVGSTANADSRPSHSICCDGARLTARPIRASPGEHGTGVLVAYADIAPRFRTLVEAALPELGLASFPPAVLPEYTLGGVGRPASSHSPAHGNRHAPSSSSKEPRKAPHPGPVAWPRRQTSFRRFSELPLLGSLQLRCSLNLYRRDGVGGSSRRWCRHRRWTSTTPSLPDARAILIRGTNTARVFSASCSALAMAEAAGTRRMRRQSPRCSHTPPGWSARSLAAQCVEGLHGLLADVRAEFNETLVRPCPKPVAMTITGSDTFVCFGLRTDADIRTAARTRGQPRPRGRRAGISDRCRREPIRYCAVRCVR